ncbi:MAG: NAD(P)-dependent glycerol-3-phosphate dehydrogenase [Gammaproteobacteria bacterium]|nr:NAD(P)-dependent glycerol-3-phosphate dehydrogenase [Gammaproteobacteria bacterium]
MASHHPIAVHGAGSWGTALAILLAQNGHDVRLWGHKPEFLQQLEKDRCNSTYLPEIAFPPNLQICPDIKDSLQGSADLLMVVPSHAFRGQLQICDGLLKPSSRLIIATKGLEQNSGKLLHQVGEEILGKDHPIAILSGPTFAREVASGLPTAVAIASNSSETAANVAQLLHNKSLRAYTTNDVIGVQLGGALKNVLAIAAGISDGLGLGANSRAALITRGLAELIRLGTALGGKQETFMGLAGVGDLILTCTDNQSRNRKLGMALGQGYSKDEAIASIGQVVEGANTTKEMMKLAKKLQIELPITEQVYRVLYENIAPQAAARALLGRERKPELG